MHASHPPHYYNQHWPNASHPPHYYNQHWPNAEVRHHRCLQPSDSGEFCLFGHVARAYSMPEAAGSLPSRRVAPSTFHLKIGKDVDDVWYKLGQELLRLTWLRRAKSASSRPGIVCREQLRLIHFTYVSARWRLHRRSVTERSTPTNGHGFTVPGLPWRSPIQVLTEIDVA